MQFTHLWKVHFILLSLCLLVVTGCTKRYDSFSKIEGTEEKVVALDFETPWQGRVQKHLMDRGFKVINYSSDRKREEVIVEGKIRDTYSLSNSRYAIKAQGKYFTDAMNRCFGGGFKFEYITATLIDTKTNQPIASYEDSGYSEGCPPMSGHIFENIAIMADRAWGSSDKIK